MKSEELSKAIMTTVVWKYQEKPEQRKSFPDFVSAMRFQAGLLKKKRGLEYAEYE